MKNRIASILVIEDEDDVRTSIVQMLRSTGFSVVDACDGRKGMAQLRQHNVTLIITDILMPEMDGLEVVIEMRKSHPAKKVLAISKGPELLQLATALGAHATLAKPIQAGDLLDAIRRLDTDEELQIAGSDPALLEKPEPEAATPDSARTSPAEPWMDLRKFNLAPAL